MRERERDRIRLGVVEPNAEKQKSRNKKIILFFGLSSSLLRPFGSLGLKWGHRRLRFALLTRKKVFLGKKIAFREIATTGWLFRPVRKNRMQFWKAWRNVPVWGHQFKAPEMKYTSTMFNKAFVVASRRIHFCCWIMNQLFKIGSHHCAADG